jgi:uncharacterized protein YigE (DUF2233 family)
MELRTIRVREPYTDTPFDMTLVRLDPAQVRFRVHYTPLELHAISEWSTMLPDALMIVNASFFTEAFTAVGLVVADGQVSGQSLIGYGGMFQVTGETVRVRSLVQEPYQGEILDQAVQAFPMLIETGGQIARTGDGFDTPSHRTMVAQDTQGRILFMVTPLGTLTFRNAQQWLSDSGLNIAVAFGLDGGKSTGMYARASDGELLHPSIDPIPVVIAAYPR